MVLIICFWSLGFNFEKVLWDLVQENYAAAMQIVQSGLQTYCICFEERLDCDNKLHLKGQSRKILKIFLAWVGRLRTENEKWRFFYISEVPYQISCKFFSCATYLLGQIRCLHGGFSLSFQRPKTSWIFFWQCCGCRTIYSNFTKSIKRWVP